MGLPRRHEDTKEMRREGLTTAGTESTEEVTEKFEEEIGPRVSRMGTDEREWCDVLGLVSDSVLERI